MPKFLVDYEHSGTIEIEAATREEAQGILDGMTTDQMLEWGMLGDLPEPETEQERAAEMRRIRGAQRSNVVPLKAEKIGFAP